MLFSARNYFVLEADVCVYKFDLCVLLFDSKASYEPYDVTEETKILLKDMDLLTRTKKNVTLRYVADLYRGNPFRLTSISTFCIYIHT